MEKKIYICIGCGKDTKAKGGICPKCYSLKDCDPSQWEIIDYEIRSRELQRDEYERWHERISGMDRD